MKPHGVAQKKYYADKRAYIFRILEQRTAGGTAAEKRPLWAAWYYMRYHNAGPKVLKEYGQMVGVDVMLDPRLRGQREARND